MNFFFTHNRLREIGPLIRFPHVVVTAEFYADSDWHARAPCGVPDVIIAWAKCSFCHPITVNFTSFPMDAGFLGATLEHWSVAFARARDTGSPLDSHIISRKTYYSNYTNFKVDHHDTRRRMHAMTIFHWQEINLSSKYHQEQKPERRVWLGMRVFTKTCHREVTS